MNEPPDFAAVIAEKDAQIALLMKRIAELEARLGLPPKTPGNSSTPPSRGEKPSGDSTPRPKGKPHKVSIGVQN